MHLTDRWTEQLAIAGIPRVPKPDLSWLEADITRFGIEGNFALVFPERRCVHSGMV